MIEVRNRVTEHVNRARLKLEARRAVRPAIVIAAAGVLAVVGAAWIISSVSKSALSSTQKVRFTVDDATGVVPGVQLVRFKGIPAGTIADVKLEGDRAILTAEVQRKYGPIFRDARATLRPNTALQDMYLDIVDRGTPEAGEAGTDEPLGARQTRMPVHVNDVLDIFRADERARLATLLDNLGRGLHDRGARLRAAFAQVAPLLEAADRISGQLARRAPLTERLVHNVGVLTKELRRRDEVLQRLVRDGAATLGSLHAGAADLDATLRELPSALSAVDTGLSAVDGVLPDLDEAVESLYPVADLLPEALTAVRRLNQSAGPAVRRLRKPVDRLVPLADALVPVSHELGSAVRTLGPQIDTVDYVTRMTAKCEKGIQGFFHWDASMSKFGDARGPIPRGNLFIGPSITGFIAGPDEFFYESCTGGSTVGGRPATEADYR